MDGREELAVRFEAERGRLGAVARRMLGSTAEAEDAVQEAWLRLERVDAAELENLPGWLTTVVSRICLDVLRGRRTEPVVVEEAVDGPEAEAELVEEVGRAMLVVLDRLGPAERVAFVLHDGFAVPFEQIGPIVGRNAVAAKKLASRARQRVRGTGEATGGDAAGSARREVVEAFLAAARGGDLDALLAVLAPEVVRRADPAALPAGRPVLLRGAGAVARETRVIGRRARFAVPVLVDGELCAAIAPDGRLRLLLRFEVADGRVAGFEVVADPARLAALELSLPGRDAS
ncbi:sigma-70 family RNA polymerase sigma factor [Kitasatospora purpeofusca]|uniref:sigma-70 family RNA polymerase sigma factor n=1 Tax=Kitasatospora purpeofusca TaxID=67352 RepID=UPI00225C3A50|nr:sigma-70 family RNA polymerase sigma factor [Kitasatospora purpeofusca]MCX4753401.1 sigma-70 family RNA polymerase sigma factor [Kitasatospora purpeofusca]WSR32905.1 sigma-70 family RNA polymerase sigma factor [Kitasatospora purpeofusca]WSR40999.1 sigma-70 family RNA polymerase sigma factor [Kitasatospora purpeofusca]